MSEEAVLLKELDDRVLTLTLNRPQQRNAMNPLLMRELVESTRDAAEDARVGCVVLRGAGKGFCAGGDISVGNKEQSETEKTPEQQAADAERAARRGPDTLERRVDWLRGNMEVVRLLHQMPKPTIAMVHGFAAGAGMNIAAACDFRIVAEKTVFTTSFIKVAFSGDYGGSYFLTHLLGSAKARELYLLGDKINADEASRIGFVSRLVAEEELELTTRELAHRLANGPALAYRYMKRNLNAAMTANLEEILDMEALHMARTGSTDDHREAARAFFEKREPKFRGS